MKIFKRNKISNDIEYIQIIEKELKPGDVIVVNYHGRLNDKAINNIKNIFNGAFPYNKVFIVEEGMDISIVKYDE